LLDRSRLVTGGRVIRLQFEGSAHRRGVRAKTLG
jgi:hypothetical protein